MGTNPSQDQNSEQSNQYGGYSGYTPQNNPSQPYEYGTYQQPDSSGTPGDPNYQYGQQQQQQQQQQYQYNTYQPPQSAARKGSYASGASGSTIMASKNTAMISYIGFFVTGIIFFLIERKNQFVRFCAAQSTLVFGSAFIVYILLRFISAIPILGFILSPILGCAISILGIAAGLLWIFLIVQTYRGVKVKLPFIGDIAERLSQGRR